MYFETTKHSGL